MNRNRVEYLLHGRKYPPVAKLDIAVDSDSKGWGFKSLRAGQDYRLKRQKARKPQILSGVFAIFMVHF